MKILKYGHEIWHYTIKLWENIWFTQWYLCTNIKQWLVIHDTLPCGCRSNSSHVKLPVPNCIQVIQICGNKPKVFWCLWGFG